MSDSEIEDVKIRLVKLLETYFRRASDFSRADMDEVAMLTAACTGVLPKRFVETVNAFDKKFSNSVSEKSSFVGRSLRILEVATDIPESDSHENLSELLPTFKLEKKDKDRVVKLCRDMRKIVFSSLDFDEPHKKRLLNRIAAIEKQVLSPTGLFDVILGGVSDVGETLQKFGKDIKPLTDRMTEVAQIARRGSKEYDQIPAPEEVKKLPPPSEDVEDN